MKMLRKKVSYFIWAIIYAFGHWMLTQNIFWGIANRDVLVAIFWNAGFIVFFVIWEKVEIYISDKIQARYAGKENGFVLRLLLRMLDSYAKGVSFKSALYLFYFVILIFASIHAASPEFFTEDFGDYLFSVQYGILLLVAADTFFKQLSIDIAWNETGG